MMLFATILFGISLFGIIALFALKYWELKKDRMLAPAMRTSADLRALQLKALALAAQKDAEKIPPLLAHGGQIALHAGVSGFAQLAERTAQGAHRLADMVSHKRNFQRRETRSEFLKKVAEHKNGNVE